MNLKKTLLAFGLAAASAISFTACSDDSSPSTPSGDEQSQDNPSKDDDSSKDDPSKEDPSKTDPSKPSSTKSDISFLPVTKNATESAQKLYNFLAVNYGSKTISGVMTGAMETASKGIEKHEDVMAVYDVSGKRPALVGFDFMNATGYSASDSWFKDYTESAMTLAKELWKLGGIPAFTWHWRDPADKNDAFYTKSGNATEYTEFDFTAGFKSGSTDWDTSSETYKQLVSDIDEIADYFLELQDAGIAAIFRPLHEASGKWFWWGTKGGEAFAALYNLVYDEMVNVKGVKNLVWVWNPEYAKDKTWNPGADHYDVISLDIYEAKDYTTKFVKGYSELTTNYGKGKILAISENGPIPDASAMHENNSVYSWWMPWYQSWSGNFMDQTTEDVWKANMADECTITLDEMPGWDKYTVSTTPAAACTPSYKLSELKTKIENPIVYPADMASNGYLQVDFTAAEGDTANGNVVIASGDIDLSKNSKISLKVSNQNPSGIWFTVAFLGNKDTDWGWAQPEGCWVDSKKDMTCEFDLATTEKDKEILSGDAYTEFMSNLSKIYIELFAEAYEGTLFFDQVETEDGTVINDFDKAQKITIEQGHFTAAKVVGNGN